MISLVRGPGGLLRRLADDFVPLLIAIGVGATAIMVLSPLHAALLAGLAWPVASAAIRAIRRRPGLRRLYRLAVWAHVIFWSVQGVLASGHEPAEAPVLVDRQAWAAAAPVEAGYGEAVFELPAWTPLAGWGARPRRLRMPPFGGLGPLGRRAQAWMAAPGEDGRPRLPMFHAAEGRGEGPLQQLGARALVLRPRGEGAGAPQVLVRLDLVTSAVDLHARILARLAPEGVTAAGLLVAATHTHSGPGGYSGNPVAAVFGTGHPNARLEDAIVEAAVAACRQAFDGLAPARLGFVRARDRDPATGRPILARNRRGEADAIDDRVDLLRVDAEATGRPIAVVLCYAVHPYLYRRRHMQFERDLAGGLEEALRARIEGRPGVLFVNGAQGDISTQPMAGTPAERIEALAARFADAIAPAVEATPTHARARLACARVERRLGTPRAFVTALGSREGVVEALDRPLTDWQPTRTIADVLALPANMVVWSLMLPEARVGFSWEGDLGAVVRLDPSMGRPRLAFGAWLLALEAEGAEEPERIAWVWQPGEAMQSLGRAWRDLGREHGADHTVVLGLVNGAMAYVTPTADFGRAGYEYDSTLFGPGTGDDVTAAIDEALGAVLDAR